jgi:hypothetical protein
VAGEGDLDEGSGWLSAELGAAGRMQALTSHCKSALFV